MCVPDSEQLTSEQEQSIADLPWAQDNPGSVRALRRLAMGSPVAFQAWMRRFGNDQTHEWLIDSFASLAFCDASAALAVLQMPFLDDAGVGDYLEAGDRLILGGLSRLARSSLNGLNRVLSHPDLQGGITDRSTALVLLLLLEDSSAAEAIRALPWMEDGITDVGGDEWPGGFVEDETAHVMGLIDMARRANLSFWVFVDIPWVRDGYDRFEWPIIADLQEMARLDDGATARVLGMPFLAIPGYGDEPITSLLLEVARRRSLQRLLSSHWLAGGIREGQLAAVALANLEVRGPDAADALNRLDWLRDGIDPSEQDVILSLVDAAIDSHALFPALVARTWVQDGLTPDEKEVVDLLSTMASTPAAGTGRADAATPLQILDMSFLEEIEPLDVAALSALSAIMLSSGKDALQLVLSHPELRGGITDDWTDFVAVTSLAARYPGLLEIVLDPERTWVDKQVVELPLAGKVGLTVVESRVTDEQYFALDVEALLEPMDLLEHAVRTYEEFMGVAFPKSDIVLLVADLEGFGGGEYGHGVIGSRWRSSAAVIAHETAHLWNVTPTWLARPTTWIFEGAAEFLASISERARRGTPLPGPEDSCSLANNIAELVRVEADPDVIFSSACNHTLGRGMFLELYDGLGDAAFRQGLRNLYLMSTEDVAAWYGQSTCGGIDAGLCHLSAAFYTGMTPEHRAIANEIITRRYFGTSP